MRSPRDNTDRGRTIDKPRPHRLERWKALLARRSHIPGCEIFHLLRERWCSYKRRQRKTYSSDDPPAIFPAELEVMRWQWGVKTGMDRRLPWRAVLHEKSLPS